ncbi:MAG: magnesium chelatase subunit D [Congregibacter sp.]
MAEPENVSQAEQELRWSDAECAAACLAVVGQGVGGIRVRARPGPVRDFWLEQTRALLPDTPWRKLPLHCSETRLLGGIDLSATLRSGQRVAERGLLAETDGGVLLLPMAERASDTLAAHLCAVLDDPVLRVEREGITARHACAVGVIALDESVEDESLGAPLAERLALDIDLRAVPLGVLDDFSLDFATIEAARARYPSVTYADGVLESLCRAMLALGVDSDRVLLLAARVGRALAALEAKEQMGAEHLETLLRLVLLPRATRLPAPPEQDDVESELEPEEAQAPDQQAEPPPPTADDAAPEDSSIDETDEQQNTSDPLDEEKILEAAAAVLPADLLARLAAGKGRIRRPKSSGKSGARQRHKQRGRPMGSLPGDPRSGARLDVMATLRAAAPWQRLRGPKEGGARLRVESQDFRVVRFRQRAQSVTVFVVDASGSAALYRLAEAKGAVELLLADCYVRRDEVALIAFRGEVAELLLPPTRSLVRAKRCLSALPGGGGTPLAAAIDATRELLEQLEHRGATPSYVMLTDGRGNVARDGRTGRQIAMEDALAAAAVMRERGPGEGIVIDTSPRPHRSASALADALLAMYLPLPNADAAQLQTAVKLVRA